MKIIEEVNHCQIQRLKFLLPKQMKMSVVMLMKRNPVKDWPNVIKKRQVSHVINYIKIILNINVQLKF